MRKSIFWLSYANEGKIPPEIGTFGDFFGVQTLDLSINELTGTPSLPLSLAFSMKEKACFPYPLSYQSDRVTCFLYILAEFCIPAGLGDFVVLSFDCASHRMTCLTASCCLAVLFSCYLLADAEASEQALQKELPKCTIFVWETPATQKKR